MPYKDPTKQRKYQRERSARLRREWLEAHGPCVRCGSADALEVDHVDPAQKVDHRVWSWSKERREAELSKCQVLCRGCHQAKTLLRVVRPVPHGTHSGYSWHGCRCEPCTQAHREYRRGRRSTCAA